MTAEETAQATAEDVPDQHWTQADPLRPSGSAREQPLQKPSAGDAVQACKESGHCTLGEKHGAEEQGINDSPPKQDTEDGSNDHNIMTSPNKQDAMSLKQHLKLQTVKDDPKKQGLPDYEYRDHALRYKFQDDESGPKDQGIEHPSMNQDQKLVSKDVELGLNEQDTEADPKEQNSKADQKEQGAEVDLKEQSITADPKEQHSRVDLNEQNDVNPKELNITVDLNKQDTAAEPQEQDAEIDSKEQDTDPKQQGAGPKQQGAEADPKEQGAGPKEQDAEAGPKQQGAEHQAKAPDRQSLSQDTEIGQEVKKRKQEVRKSTTVRLSCLPKSMLCGIILVICLTVAEASYDIVPTKQFFPQTCLQSLASGCPNRLYFPSRWQEISQSCCRDYPGYFHCQVMKSQTHIIIGCLPQQVIPAGKTGELVVNEMGYPEQDTATNCSTGTYRSKSINSSDNAYGYCVELKEKINPETETRICDGGPVDDDRIVCKEGYESDCPHGRYRDNVGCICRRSQCDKGSQPFRKITGNCSDKNLTVHYGCRKGQVMSSPSPPRFQENSSETHPDLTTSTPHSITNTPQSGMSTGEVTGIVCVVVIVLIGVVCFVAWWCKKNRGYYKMSDLN